MTIGTALLTPQYACPEQVRGETVTVASDIYSLGAVLYELLTGERPHVFSELTPQVIEKVVCERDVIAPSEAVRNEKLAARLRGDLDTIVLHAMHKEPSRRYETVERFAEDIRRYLSDEPITARPDHFVYRSRKFLRRNRLAVGVALALLIAFGAGFLFSSELRHRLVSSRTRWAGSALTTDNQVGSRLQRVELLVVLGDSFARDHNWKNALLAYQQAQAQIPNNLAADDPALQALRDRISAGIALGQEQQRMNEKK